MVSRWYADRMPKVEKVTVSLPAALYAYVEREREQTGATRSETIASLLWRAKQAQEREEMEERYAKAYAEHPETEEEGAWMLAASAEMFANAGAEWEEFAPKRGSSPSQREEAETDAPREAGASRKAATRAAR